ncbi:MAG: nucleotidyltransferase domain-containing protein [Thermoleophilia bacterium]|nr:nucleotidyltransferase domain-containing protein [Thermoleophilia bacterium]
MIARAGVGTGAVHRELSRLVRSGIVTVTPMGRQRRYQANRESPVFAELHGLIQKTVGLVEPLKRALEALAGRIEVAFVYGSVADGRDTSQSDIDLMIIADDLPYAETYQALAIAETTLARTISLTILSPAEWHESRQRDNHFIETVARQPRVLVLGSEDGIT